jgi:hypothetical protein
MRNAELFEQLQLQMYLGKIYFTLSATISCFLLGLVLYSYSIIKDLKVSLLVIASFILIFIHKKPCLFQYSCLFIISLSQGVLFAALFIYRSKTTISHLFTGMFATMAIVLSIFGIAFHSDKKFKQNLGQFSIALLCILIISIFLVKIVNLLIQSRIDGPIILLFMIAHLLSDINIITTSPEFISRNYILDTMLLSFDIFQVFIRTLLILNEK